MKLSITLLSVLVVGNFIFTENTRANLISVNFDNVVASSEGTTFPGDTFSSEGVFFKSGLIPNTINMGDIFTLSNPRDEIVIIADNSSISPPNFLGMSKSVFGQADDVLLFFSTPITSLEITTDDYFFEPPDIVRLLALEPTGNILEFKVLALDEGIDNAISSPDNLLSVELGGVPFSYALFQTTTEAEGFDNLTATPITEPATLVLFGLGTLSIAGLVRRRRGTSSRGGKVIIDPPTSLLSISSG